MASSQELDRASLIQRNQCHWPVRVLGSRSCPPLSLSSPAQRWRLRAGPKRSGEGERPIRSGRLSGHRHKPVRIRPDSRTVSSACANVIVAKQARSLRGTGRSHLAFPKVPQVHEQRTLQLHNMQDFGTAAKARLVNARARITILLPFAAPALALAVSGCVAYEPKPVRHFEIATARRALVVNPADARRRVTDLAPARASRPMTWDRLSLFAAATIYNPDIAAAWAGVVTARASAAFARQWPNSMLTLTAEYADDPATGSPWLFGGSIELPLDLGARRSSRAVVADLAILAAWYDVAETTWVARMAFDCPGRCTGQCSRSRCCKSNGDRLRDCHCLSCSCRQPCGGKAPCAPRVAGPKRLAQVRRSRSRIGWRRQCQD
jgi:hypothetical protein